MSAPLPHGAKGLQGDGFAVAFGEDMIVFTLKQQPEDGGEITERHYTLKSGRNSGVIDIHETHSFPDGHKEHKTLFALRTDDLPPLVQQFTALVPELIGLIRPLRIGWMKHRDIGVARGVEPISDADIAAVTTKRKRKLAVDPQRYQDHVFEPRCLKGIYDFPDGNFTLFHRNRNIGMGFKKTYPDGTVRLYWIKRRDLMRFGTEWQQKVIAALQAIAIPPEDYGKYPFPTR